MDGTFYVPEGQAAQGTRVVCRGSVVTVDTAGGHHPGLLAPVPGSGPKHAVKLVTLMSKREAGGWLAVRPFLPVRSPLSTSCVLGLCHVPEKQEHTIPSLQDLMGFFYWEPFQASRALHIPLEGEVPNGFVLCRLEAWGVKYL